MIGIVIAIREELLEFFSKNEFVKDKQQDENQSVYTSHLMPDVVIIESGMGKENAINATSTLIAAYQPKIIISAGFAGSVIQNTEPGTAYICSDIWSMPGPAAFWSTQIAENVQILDENRALRLNSFISDSGSPVNMGSCMTVDQFIYNHDLKTWIGKNFSVDVIDMESFWVSQTAREKNIEPLVIRVVLDPMEQKLPPFIVEAANNKRSRTMLSGLKHVAINPGDIKKIFEITMQVRKARRILTSNLDLVVDAERQIGSITATSG